MPQFKVFDYGAAVDTGQRNAINAMNIREAQADRPVKNALRQQQMTQIDEAQQLENTKLLYQGLTEIGQNPAAANYWLPRFKERGIIRPEFNVEGKAPQEIQQDAMTMAKQIGAGLQARLSSASTPKYGQPKEGVQGGKNVFWQADQAGNINVLEGIAPPAKTDKTALQKNVPYLSRVLNIPKSEAATILTQTRERGPSAFYQSVYTTALRTTYGDDEESANIAKKAVERIFGRQELDQDVPSDLPQGSKLIGTSNGKPVYEAPDGRRFTTK